MWYFVLFIYQVFAMLNLTPYDLSVDRLDVHAVSLVITVLLTIKIECVVLRNIHTHPL